MVRDGRQILQRDEVRILDAHRGGGGGGGGIAEAAKNSLLFQHVVERGPAKNRTTEYEILHQPGEQN